MGAPSVTFGYGICITAYSQYCEDSSIRYEETLKAIKSQTDELDHIEFEKWKMKI